MPPFETMDCRQKAVLWAVSNTLDSFGHYIVDAPVEIDVRWENKKHEETDAQGNPITLDAFVIAKQEIGVGSEMWLGKLDDYNGTGSGGDDSEIMRVVTSNKFPDIKNKNIRYELGLQRFRDEPATT